MSVDSQSAATALLQRLRAETRPHHDAIETALDLTSDALTLGSYHQTLVRFHGFYRPLEIGVHAVGGWAARGLDLSRRWKTPLLEADLRTFAVGDHDALSVCTKLPPHDTVASAFGCLYVLEGATLGGQIISRALERSLGITPQTGGQFFYGYGDRTGKMWHEFRAALATHSIGPSDSDEIVSAAKDTFSTLRRWIETGKN